MENKGRVINNGPMANPNWFLVSYAPQILSILRMVAAFLFFWHGTQKMIDFPAPPPAPPDTIRVVAAWLEVIGGPLLFLGLFTRPVAFILSGEMAIGYFVSHHPRGPWPLLNLGEVAILNCFLFLYLSAAGGGAWSLDNLLKGKR
jgi:putative oxidoreductase